MKGRRLPGKYRECKCCRPPSGTEKLRHMKKRIRRIFRRFYSKVVDD